MKRKIDIYKQLLSRVYQINYTTVCNYIKKKFVAQQAYNNYVPKPGHIVLYGIAHVFAHTGGFSTEMVYYNMRLAITEFVGRHEKIPLRHY